MRPVSLSDETFAHESNFAGCSTLRSSSGLLLCSLPSIGERSSSYASFSLPGKPDDELTFPRSQFGVINALFIPVIYFTYPETAGRTLEEIDLMYAPSLTSSLLL